MAVARVVAVRVAVTEAEAMAVVRVVARAAAVKEAVRAGWGAG